MLSRSLLTPRRIPLLRPLRPPNLPQPRRPHPRLFTHNSQLLLISKHNPRPQLPYLSQPAFAHPGQSNRIARLISTETREAWIAQAWLTAKWIVIVWVFFFLGSVAWTGIGIEQQERQNPTPAEWRFWTRQALRHARNEGNVVKDKKGVIVDWAAVGSYLKECLRRLEDPSYDGQGLEEVGGDGEKILIPDVGKAGPDISGKSHEWRTCYFEVVMGCAAAAEHLEGTVVDRTRGKVYKADMVVGPSNPDPRPVPAFVNSGLAPKEEDCEPTSLPPETYYMRVLTGKGFTTRQKLAAVDGYANWLEFKGLNDSAEEMYRWGIDIAKAALPADTGSVMDATTAVLNADGSHEATPNLLQATTNLAIHHARTGNIQAALPIFLSILRARRAAPLYSQHVDQSLQASDDSTKSDIGAAVSKARRFFSPPQFPPPPPSGDDQITRASGQPSCIEAELMLYIGEILFASSEQSNEGIGWTRNAVRIAEANLAANDVRNRQNISDAEERENQVCNECLLTGVGNWELMLKRLAEQKLSSAAREGGRSAGILEWRGWFGGGDGVKGKTLDEVEPAVVEAELRQVELLREKIIRDGIEEALKEAKPQIGQSWIG